jgi:hypothetical protein
MAYVEDLGSALNDVVQKSKNREDAERLLNERGPVLIREVADLNHIEFSAARPRKETMIRAILDDRFGTA